VTGTSTVNLKLEVSYNQDGAGFTAYETVYDAEDTSGSKITTAGDGGIYMRGTATRITYFNAEDLATVTDVNLHGTGRGVLRGVGRGIG
jgi:hypothetical protein